MTLNAQVAVGYVTITLPPGTPTAAADAYTCSYNASCAVTAAAGLLTNDTSPNLGAVKAVNNVTAPPAAAGTLTVGADGAFVFAPSM